MITAAVWILLCATFLGLMVSALHYALRDYSVVRLRELTDANGASPMVEGILDDVDGHALATGAVRVLCNVAITLAAVVVLRVFHAPMEVADAAGGAGELAISYPRLAGAFALASGLIYVFGLLIPMSIAEHAGDRLIYAFAAPLRALHVVLWPLRVLAVVDVAIKRLAGAEHVTEGQRLEEQIISVVAEGEREGQLGETQRDMIEAVVDFKGRTVDQIMTPRTEIEGFEYTDDLSFVRRFIEEHGYSRIPVYQGDLDHIAGVLYAKDLIPFLGSDPTKFKLRPVLRRAVFVPETKSLTDLLYELRARKVHLAIVADEYGGTAGLVTFEDLLEEIVGEIQDEYEPTEQAAPEIEVKLEHNCAEVEARAYVSDVNEALEPIGVEVPSSEEYDTLGGYVLAKLGHIPEPGESFADEGFVVTVLSAEPTRVKRLKIERVAPDETDTGGQQTTGESTELAANEEPAPDHTPRVAGA